ncbi:MAG: DUF624 domain-containing protein [Lachnospiraceae bacterium]|nr:DUF624 domain-containing protein [Lachnospiraceae bacterium]
MNIFSSRNLLGRFMNWVGNIVILNFLWLIFSLPIVTIGASTTALYYSTMKWIRRDEGYIHTNFIKSFKENFKQSTIMWLLMLLLGFVITLDLRIGMFFNNGQAGITMGKIMVITSILLFIPYILVLTYIFPVQAKFENSIKDNIKNAFLMSIAHFGYTLLIFFILFTFVFLTLTSKVFIGLEILTGFGLYGYMTSALFVAVFRKHLPDELVDDADAIGIDKLN